MNIKGKGNAKDKKLKPWQIEEIQAVDIELGYLTYQEKPDYLLETTAKATYDYDAKGNRTKYVTDNEDLEYSYDAEDRLLSDGKDEFGYDANGNMTGVKSGEDTVEYVYNAANKLTEVKYPDGTYVKYGYDAFGRKVSREEAYWNKEEGDAPGKSEYAPGQNKEKSNNGNGKGNPNGSANGNANGKAEKKNPLKLKTDTTSYLYDGFTNAVTNEYTGNGSPLGQYYMANDRVVSKKTFGNHGLVIPGREPSLKTNGGLMDYHYDGMRNVTELTDRNGDSIEEYSYDAFGGLYTGITAPYNTYGFAGKSYDPKANLVDNNARWYQAQTGRFTSADPYRGELLTPYTQNRYAYVGNNPVNRWDPLGYWMEGDGDLSSAAKSDIRYLEGLYDQATTQEEKDDIHDQADEIRSRDRDRWTEESEDKIGSWYGIPDIDRNAPVKISDGWNTSWTRVDYYNEKYKITESRYSDYAGLLYSNVSYRTDTTATTTRGVDFRPFTATEWYQENKVLLEKYDIPISQAKTEYEPRDAYSKTLSTTRETTSVEKIVSRTDNNQYKDGIIAQGIYVAGISEKLKGIGSGQGTGKPAGGNQILNGAKAVGGQIFNSLGIVLGAPGNILRNVSVDLGSGNFTDIPSGIWGGITGERQTTVLDLAMTKDGQAEFQQSHPNLYQITSVATSFIDPMVIIPGAKAASAGTKLEAGFTVVKRAGNTKVFNPMNKGPLQDTVANTFRSGTYTEVVTQGETTLYRVYGGKVGKMGSYWTKTKPQGPLQSTIDSALDQNWGNTATNIATIKVPKGTTIYQGAAAPQVGLVGGGSQVYIPEVNSSWLVK